MNIKKDTIKRFVNETGLNIYIGYRDKYTDNYISSEKFDFSNIGKMNYLLINGFQEDGTYIGKFFNVPKSKEVTLDYIMNKLNQESVYRNLSDMFSKLCKNLAVYPTTYGIGIDAFYNFGLDDEIKQVEDKLNELGIEYRTEFSEARYVYRFVISKKSINLQKIK